MILNLGSSGCVPSPRLGVVCSSGKRCFSHGNREMPLQSSFARRLQHPPHFLHGKLMTIMSLLYAAIKGMSFLYGKLFLVIFFLKNGF